MKKSLLRWLGLASVIQENAQFSDTVKAQHARIVDLERRVGELTALVVDLQTAPKALAPRETELEPASTWQRQKQRASAGA